MIPTKHENSTEQNMGTWLAIYFIIYFLYDYIIVNSWFQFKNSITHNIIIVYKRYSSISCLAYKYLNIYIVPSIMVV